MQHTPFKIYYYDSDHFYLGNLLDGINIFPPLGRAGIHPEVLQVGIHRLDGLAQLAYGLGIIGISRFDHAVTLAQVERLERVVAAQRQSHRANAGGANLILVVRHGQCLDGALLQIKQSSRREDEFRDFEKTSKACMLMEPDGSAAARPARSKFHRQFDCRPNLHW